MDKNGNDENESEKKNHENDILRRPMKYPMTNDNDKTSEQSQRRDHGTGKVSDGIRENGNVCQTKIK